MKLLPFIQKVPLALACVAAVCGLSGCPVFLLGGAAAGTAVYQVGALNATRNITLDEAYNSGVQALEDLGVVIVSKEKDGLTGFIVAKGTEDVSIKIRTKKIFDDVTEINIRVGLIGDELQSRLIYDRMEKIFTAGSGRSGTGVSPSLPPPPPRLY